MKLLLKKLCSLAIHSIILTSLTNLAQACPACYSYTFPKKTATDYLLVSRAVVLARENPNSPFSYQVIETLKGDVTDTAVAVHLFLNSTTRRRLAHSPERAVVLVQSERDGRWIDLGFVSAEYEKIVREIIRHAPQWQEYGSNNEQRLKFFSRLLGHKDSSVHELAYMEIARMPYNKIKKLSSAWSRDSIRAFLRNMWYIEWHPLAILMLAQNSTQNDRQYIIDNFTRAERWGLTTNLSARATAFIEVKNADAISFIEERYFRSADRSREELVAVTSALSVHGSNGHKHLRDRIVQSYKILLEYHPEMAGYVAKDLTAWHRRDLIKRLTEILKEVKGEDPLTAYAIKLYLKQAAQTVR